ncbi:hypothetical protein WHU37_27445 (plasmid) [Escherichia coli]|uniref:hypothetical protein n=1 Tax=Escherichia coli TaxID=562 RepID=UPI00311ADFF2
MIWQPEFTDKTLSRKPGAVQFIPVLSGSETGLSIFDEIIAEKGDVAPDIWIPELLKRLNG